MNHYIGYRQEEITITTSILFKGRGYGEVSGLKEATIFLSKVAIRYTVERVEIISNKVNVQL